MSTKDVVMARTLRGLAWAMGGACFPIGLVHLLGGNASVPGLADAGPTVDSRERFYGALFAGYGAAWLWVAAQRPIPAGPVRRLTAVFWLGGLGRLLSLGVAGRPQSFQRVLTGVEIALPPVLLGLAGAEEPRAGGS
jgi:hypothetical protein